MTAFNVPGFPTLLDEVSNNIESTIKQHWKGFFAQVITPKMKLNGWNFITDLFEQEEYPKTLLLFSFAYRDSEGYTATVKGNVLETYLYLSVRDPSGTPIGDNVWLREPLVIPYHSSKRVLDHKGIPIKQTVYHISGHLDLTNAEFKTHYQPEILSAISSGAKFVIGDAPGADDLAQRYLFACSFTDVTVYHMLDKPRNNIGFPTRGKFVSDEDRDQALTKDSEADIAWIRPGKENSGTAKNIARRAAA
jgi:hypothetical protein